MRPDQHKCPFSAAGGHSCPQQRASRKRAANPSRVCIRERLRTGMSARRYTHTSASPAWEYSLHAAELSAAKEWPSSGFLPSAAANVALDARRRKEQVRGGAAQEKWLVQTPEHASGGWVGKNSRRTGLGPAALDHLYSHRAGVRGIGSAVQTLRDMHRGSLQDRGTHQPQNQHAADGGAKGRGEHDLGFQGIPQPLEPRQGRVEIREALCGFQLPDASNNLFREPIKITRRGLLVPL